MNSTEFRLRERDVRKDAPELSPNEFLSMYLQSNFPQTAALASAEQKERNADVEEEGKKVDYSYKKGMSGTSFDNPGRY